MKRPKSCKDKQPEPCPTLTQWPPLVQSRQPTKVQEAFICSCKAALSNMIAADRLYESEDPYTEFSAGIVNFHAHYCLDEHSSYWCYHEKVCRV